MLDGFSRALGDPRGTPDAMTLSYGGCAVAEATSAPTYVTITNEVLAMLAMSGTSTFIASGDSGSTSCPGSGVIPTLSFPAVSPVVTAVGGTRLTLNAKNGRKSEVVWNDTPYGEQAAGGGALALATPKPPYQDQVNPAATRAVPDVSALADIQPGWPVFFNGNLDTVGGPSGSSPFIAAATALVDAQQRSHAAPRVGLANGWFYHAARDPASFYDVMHGQNGFQPLSCCTASPGYDLASGLGVPNWSVLPSQLPAPGADAAARPVRKGCAPASDSVHLYVIMNKTTVMFNAEADGYTRRCLVPCFDAFYGGAIRALELAQPGPIRAVLDLGTGTGALAAMVADTYPQAQLTLLDGAPAMMAKAVANLGERATTAVVQDFAEPLPAGPFDAVVSSLAIHHLDDAGKASLYTRAHDVLRPGGAFINAEQVLGETPALDALFWRWHEREALALGATREEWAAAVSRMTHDRCATVATNLELLSAAGFQDVCVHFADGRFAVLAGRRAA
jgi:tRNA (cmo5U34)-methyltransferase